MARSGQLDVKGVLLNWRLEGEGGAPLICIHGVGSYLEAWSGVTNRLKDRFAVLTFDLRGHGRSSRVKGRYEIDDFVGETLERPWPLQPGKGPLRDRRLRRGNAGAAMAAPAG